MSKYPTCKNRLCWRHCLGTTCLVGAAAYFCIVATIAGCGHSPYISDSAPTGSVLHAKKTTSDTTVDDSPKLLTPPISDRSQGVPFYFEDMTEHCGLSHIYENGESSNQYTILESLGGGVAIFDYDRDGALDILLATGGTISESHITGLSPRLFRQVAPWKFVDVTADVGLDRIVFYHHGFAIADFDQDEWLDVVITGYGRAALLRNSGGRRFVDVTDQAGISVFRNEPHWSTVALWADFDQDGDRDLFIGHYVDWTLVGQPVCRGYGPNQPRDICPPNRFAALPPQLFYNNGDGTFIELAHDAGLLPGKALGAVCADWNHDGLLDLYVANDAVLNHLYINKGSRDFSEEGLLRGVAGGAFGEPEGSMGVACLDLGNEGLLSLAVTNYQGQWHALYRHRTDGGFDYVTARHGWAALGTNHVGWGVVFGDWDLDGDQDAVIAQGHVIRHPPAPQTLAQPTLLLLNETSAQKPGPIFRTVTAEGYFATPHRGRAVAVADLDDDGQLDLIITHIGEPARILRNVTCERLRSAGTTRHWWGLDMKFWQGRDQTGWQIRLADAQGRKIVRTLTSGDSYLAVHDRRVVLGLAEADSLRAGEIAASDGRVWQLSGSMLQVDRYHAWDYRKHP